MEVSQSNMPTQQLCAVWDFMPPPHLLSMSWCCLLTVRLPPRSNQPSKPRGFPKDPFWTLTIFPPQWAPGSQLTCSLQAAQLSHAAMRQLMQSAHADLLIASQKFVLNLFVLAPPEQGCFLCIPKHMATA